MYWLEAGYMKIINKKARFNYEIGETLEAGVVLTGAEAKAARAGSVDLVNSHVKIIKNEPWVVGMQIFPYKFADNTDYDPMRMRKLLVGKKELVILESKMKQGRLTLVPTALYTKGPKVKLEIGLARGKRKYEKREAIKKREWERSGGGGN